MSAPTVTPEERRRRMIVALNSARPSHAWAPWSEQGVRRPGCSKCPDRSPFQLDRASHPYVIEEEL